jgi:hypothetical protein
MLPILIFFFFQDSFHIHFSSNIAKSWPALTFQYIF